MVKTNKNKLMARKYLWLSAVAGMSALMGLLVVAGTAYAVVPTLSQTTITVGLGQSATVTSENGVQVYLDSNSVPTIASVSVDGTQITVTGNEIGSTMITLCNVGTASDCTSLNVNVQQQSVSGISFSQSNLSLSTGNNESVTVSGGNGTYHISSNSNTGVASASLSGSTLNISAVASGSASITVCDTAGNCGTLTATVNSSSNGSVIAFSQNNFSLNAGGSEIVNVSGGSGVYNISSNSNTSVVSANLSGSQLTVDAITSGGSASITVCDTSGNCGTLYVSVVGSTNTNQAVTFGTTNPTVSTGQTLSVSLSGGSSGYVLLSNANANIAQASIDGNALSITGESAGTDTFTVCATDGGCGSVTATISGSTVTTTAPTTVTTVTGSVVPNATLLSEIQTLQSAVTAALAQIESMQTELNQLEAQVNAGSGVNASVSASSGSSYDFTELLTVGSEDAQVTQLQQRLTTLGFYSGPITGYYGSLTEQAVIKYQAAHSITETGDVGPSTRAALNAGD